MKNKQKILPFFPLGVFLLPGEDMPLRIFEPRYLQLVEEVREEGFTFIIPYIKDDIIMDFGCEVKLQQVVAESVKGQKVITVEAVSLVRIHNYTEQMAGKLYGGGNAEILPASPKVVNQQLLSLIKNYVDRYDLQFSKDVVNTYDMTYFDVIKALNLSSEDKYRFVGMTCDNNRDRFLIHQIEYLMLIRQQEKMLDDDFRLN